jgi:hypothetical protein
MSHSPQQDVFMSGGTKCQQQNIHKKRPVLQEPSSDDETNLSPEKEHIQPQKRRRRITAIEEEEDDNGKTQDLPQSIGRSERRAYVRISVSC